MIAIPFDVFAFTHSLVDAGITEKQADSIAQAFTKAIQESNTNVMEQVKRDYHLDDVVTNKSLDARILETELKIEQVKNEIKSSEIRVISQLAAIQQDMQNTKITNRALLGLVALAVGMLVKLVL